MAPERSRILHYRLPGNLGPSQVASSDEHALDFILTAEMVAGWLLPNASNFSFLVELCKGELHGYGVYKPGAGEAPLWDFPSGNLYKRECAAYVMSEFLGWGFVPPTVQREGELGTGSLQLYVPPQEASNFFTVREHYRNETFRMAVFDMIVNNADRKGGHCFEAEDGSICGCDHGLTFHVTKKLRTVIWDYGGEMIPNWILDDVRALPHQLALPTSPVAAALLEWITPAELQAVGQRVAAILEKPVMPQPTTRRDFPWPYI
jgi:hypothetical protein